MRTRFAEDVSDNTVGEFCSGLKALGMEHSFGVIYECTGPRTPAQRNTNSSDPQGAKILKIISAKYYLSTTAI